MSLVSFVSLVSLLGVETFRKTKSRAFSFANQIKRRFVRMLKLRSHNNQSDLTNVCNFLGGHVSLVAWAGILLSVSESLGEILCFVDAYSQELKSLAWT